MSVYREMQEVERAVTVAVQDQGHIVEWIGADPIMGGWYRVQVRLIGRDDLIDVAAQMGDSGVTGVASALASLVLAEA